MCIVLGSGINNKRDLTAQTWEYAPLDELGFRGTLPFKRGYPDLLFTLW